MGRNHDSLLLLRTLDENVVGANARSTRWWTPKPNHVREQHVEHAVEILGGIAQTANWSLIPSLLYLLIHEDARLASRASDCIATLTDRVPIDQLGQLEGQVRSSTLRAYSWHELTVGRVARREWPSQLWKLFTFHRSGLLREAALRWLVADTTASDRLPFLLLRANDWVRPIRAYASAEIKTLLRAEHLDAWLPSLGLVQSTRHRSRADHAWISEALASLLLVDAERPRLESLIRSSPRAVARWALEITRGVQVLEHVQFLVESLSHPDPAVRLHVVRQLLSVSDLQDRSEIIAQAARDPYMPVRREAMYGILGAPSHVRESHLRGALFDRHVSMRHAARTYLREKASVDGIEFDPRAIYLGAIHEHATRPTASAILGLGECGVREDVAVVRPYITSPVPSLAAAALRAARTLDSEGAEGWCPPLIADSRPAVSREATRFLAGRRLACDQEALRAIKSQSPHAHVRRNALRLLLGRNPYEAIVDAIESLKDADPQVAQMASDYIDNAHARPARQGPSDEQVAEAAKSLHRSGSALSASQASIVRARFGIAGN
ncbi:MAG: hypothetical protein KF902_00755 [Phycisphaeraceae bacterium]|nr:hypothetical protein [Phycisphaeraceae bacterium]